MNEVTELAKLGLMIYLQAVKTAGLTEEEAKALFESEKLKFDSNTPDKLNKV